MEHEPVLVKVVEDGRERRGQGHTVHVVISCQFDDNLVVLISESKALHVGAIVVPPLAQLQLHAHLHLKEGLMRSQRLLYLNSDLRNYQYRCWRQQQA